MQPLLNTPKSIAHWNESKDIVQNGIVDEKYYNFNSYIKSLRTDENYDHVGEETALAAAELFKREVHTHYARLHPQLYKPSPTTLIVHDPINIAFMSQHIL